MELAMNEFIYKSVCVIIGRGDDETLPNTWLVNNGAK